MTTDALREQVEKEIGTRWAEFALRHPRLADELGREVYVARAIERIESDPAYQAAMQGGRTGAAGLEVVANLIARVVRRVLG